jgi:hypothetical protein
MRTMDLDRWFSSKPEIQKGVQDVLRSCNAKGTISFLSVAFIAGAEMRVKDKHEAAMEYMETRVSIKSAWKSNFRKNSNEVNSAEGKYDYFKSQAERNAAMKEADTKLQTARQNLRQQENEFETQQRRKKVFALRAKIRRQPGNVAWFFGLFSKSRWPWERIPEPEPEEKISTDYYFQILADESVEKVFGHVFARLLRGVKSKAAFTSQGREYESLSPFLNLGVDDEGSESSSSEEEEEAGVTAEDEEEGDLFGGVFDGFS